MSNSKDRHQLGKIQFEGKFGFGTTITYGDVGTFGNDPTACGCGGSGSCACATAPKCNCGGIGCGATSKIKIK